MTFEEKGIFDKEIYLIFEEELLNSLLDIIL